MTGPVCNGPVQEALNIAVSLCDGQVQKALNITVSLCDGPVQEAPNITGPLYATGRYKRHRPPSPSDPHPTLRRTEPDTCGILSVSRP